MPERTTGASTESAADVAREDLTVSLVIIGLIIAFALVQLGFQGNWPKVLRVSLAFLTYSTVLLCLIRWTLKAEQSSLPYHIFAVAAGAAELCSGWLRPDWRISDVLTIPLIAAVLIGGLHWLALRVWRPLHLRLLSGRK